MGRGLSHETSPEDAEFGAHKSTQRISSKVGTNGDDQLKKCAQTVDLSLANSGLFSLPGIPGARAALSMRDVYPACGGAALQVYETKIELAA